MLFLPRRLAKFVRDATSLSVEEIRKAWQQGRISVEAWGAADRGLEDLVFEDDRVCLDGRRLAPRTQHSAHILHKPARVTCTARDPRGKADLSAYLRAMPQGSFPVGRLDRDTTGLLLFTTDGNLANSVLRPQHETLKRYWLWLNESFEGETDPRLREMTTPSSTYDCARSAVLHHQGPAGTELIVTLDKGKNRQIRRLCRALGLRLQHLHRVSIGALTLGALSPGEHRALTADEVEGLWQSTGGRGSTEQAQLAALYRDAADRRASGQPDRRLEAWLAPFS
jgi:23S rRNA pseudouridine2605 synthase